MKFRRQDGGREIFLDGKAGLQMGSYTLKWKNQLTLGSERESMRSLDV